VFSDSADADLPLQGGKARHAKFSCLLFEISGQRFAKFAVDLNDAIRQLGKASLECFRNVLVLGHV